jgi:hypothetical protein
MSDRCGGLPNKALQQTGLSLSLRLRSGARSLTAVRWAEQTGQAMSSDVNIRKPAEAEAEWKRVATKFGLELARGGHGLARVLVASHAGGTLSLGQRPWGLGGAIQGILPLATSFVVCDNEFLALCHTSEVVDSAERVRKDVAKLATDLPEHPACRAFALPHRQLPRTLDIGGLPSSVFQLFPEPPAPCMAEPLVLCESIPTCFKVGAWNGIAWVDVYGAVDVEDGWLALADVADRCKSLSK